MMCFNTCKAVSERYIVNCNVSLEIISSSRLDNDCKIFVLPNWDCLLFPLVALISIQTPFVVVKTSGAWFFNLRVFGNQSFKNSDILAMLIFKYKVFVLEFLSESQLKLLK